MTLLFVGTLFRIYGIARSVFYHPIESLVVIIILLLALVITMIKRMREP